MTTTATGSTAANPSWRTLRIANIDPAPAAESTAWEAADSVLTE
jgi:hypothetical protein